MKRLLAVLVVLALPAVASAQANDVCVGSVCWTPTTGEITAQTYLRDQHNAGVCASAGLPASCTQAEYDAVDPTPLAAVVYADTGDGVRTFYSERMKAASLKDVAAYESEYKGRGSNVWNQANTAERQAMCVAGGADVDCVLP